MHLSQLENESFMLPKVPTTPAAEDVAGAADVAVSVEIVGMEVGIETPAGIDVGIAVGSVCLGNRSAMIVEICRANTDASRGFVC